MGTLSFRISRVQLNILDALHRGEKVGHIFPRRSLEALERAGRIAFNRKVGTWELTDIGRRHQSLPRWEHPTSGEIWIG